jgi:triphosphoribosyl-dephospho-CoA synthase
MMIQRNDDSATDLLALHVQLCCIHEATARKAGNVHRWADFSDTGYVDFLTSAAAIAPVLGGAPTQPLGATVLEAVRRTRLVARGNTNLGIVLLLAPLAKASSGSDYRANVVRVLEALTVKDSELVYRGIVLARAGGLGQVEQQDVRDRAPTIPLRAAMALAADRDLIARQYSNGFVEVFDEGVPAIQVGRERTGCLEGSILHAQLHLMKLVPDSLIARKRGREEAEEAARRAGEVLAAGWPGTEAGRLAWRQLDDWLRAEGHQRNPGTTADLIAASLFVLLRQENALPPTLPWTTAELGL